MRECPNFTKPWAVHLPLLLVSEGTMFFRSLAEHYVIPEGIEGITLKQEKRQSQSLVVSLPPALQDSSKKPLNK